MSPVPPAAPKFALFGLIEKKQDCCAAAGQQTAAAAIHSSADRSKPGKPLTFRDGLKLYKPVDPA
jgi:hypothetical protein